ncbi:uncharacterized protein SOCE26_048020 [Sorangium cellulosum]|uniref:Peptidase M10 metallopeptidase domain-containing protein n=1 Tax=Sorangium cellulosum TaxID=56 RepID=A0A2L0EVM9_SORCE|nr:hypothetical protein [Sorangium cellulosum]AUX43354.1 uncharacterized protein SOCE26_048020 [Sorangium cellulosum]
MSTLSKIVAGTLSAAAALALGPRAAHAYAYLYGGFGCSGAPYHVSGDRGVWPRCPDAATGTLGLESGYSSDITAGAFWSWQALNTANPEIFLHRGSGCVTNAVPSGDGVSVAWLSSSAFSYGRMTPQVNCGFFGAPDITALDIEVNSSQFSKHINCRYSEVTQDGTWVHELGHAYGQAHFDDWLSTMNSYQNDISSCREDRAMRPSSDAQHGQKHHPLYGGLPAGVDVGGTATSGAGCNLATQAYCAHAPGWTVNIPAGATTFTGSVHYTSMNMRDAFPGGHIPVAVWLSADNYVSAGDARVLNIAQFDTFGGAIYEYEFNFAFNPAVIPVGQTWCALVQWDPDRAVAEVDESDNVIDTNYCFRRL